MINLKQFFVKPSPMELAARELIEAQHALLIAETGLDWAQASVDYNKNRILRLNLIVAGKQL